MGEEGRRVNEGEREIKDACKVFCFLIMSTRNYVERSVSRDLEKGLGGRCRLMHVMCKEPWKSTR